MTTRYREHIPHALIHPIEPAGESPRPRRWRCADCKQVGTTAELFASECDAEVRRTPEEALIDAIEYGEHDANDTDCGACWKSYPKPCARGCRSLVHAEFGDENAENRSDP